MGGTADAQPPLARVCAIPRDQLRIDDLGSSLVRDQNRFQRSFLAGHSDEGAVGNRRSEVSGAIQTVSARPGHSALASGMNWPLDAGDEVEREPPLAVGEGRG